MDLIRPFLLTHTHAKNGHVYAQNCSKHMCYLLNSLMNGVDVSFYVLQSLCIDWRIVHKQTLTLISYFTIPWEYHRQCYIQDLYRNSEDMQNTHPKDVNTVLGYENPRIVIVFLHILQNVSESCWICETPLWPSLFRYLFPINVCFCTMC